MSRGSSTLEILTAFVVLTLAITAVILLVFGAQSVSVDTQTNLEALTRARAMLEEARAQARQNFVSVVSTSEINRGLYNERLAVEFVSDDVKRATSVVSWQDGLRTLSVSLSTLLTNFGNPGELCALVPSGDWRNPQHYDFYSDKDLVSQATGNQSNGLGISDLKIFRDKLYLAAATAANNGTTFYIFDLPPYPNQAPVFRGTPTSITNSMNAVALGAQGNKVYAFLANGRSANFGTCTEGPNCAQLLIVDVTNPVPGTWSPPIKNFKVPGVSGTGGQGVGRSVFYQGGYVYLGIASTTGPEFHIIDVGGGVGSPMNPVRVGGREIGYTVNSILVRGNRAYLATNNNASDNEQLLVLDVIDKNLDPLPYAGSFSAPGIGFGRALALTPGRIYFGRTFSGSSVPNFYILNNTALPALPVLGSRVLGTSDSVNKITLQDNVAFVLTNKQFQIWDISNPGSMVPHSADGTTGTFLNLQDIAQGQGNSLSGSTASSCVGNHFYIAVQTTGNNKDILSVVTPKVVNSYLLENSGSLSLMPGATGNNTITKTLTSGFPQSVTLTVSGLPDGAAASFSNNPCITTCTSVLTIVTSLTTPPGIYPIVVTGTGGVTTTFDLVISTHPFDYTVSTSDTITVAKRRSTSNTVRMTLVSPPAVPVNLSITGLPRHVSASFSPSSCTPTCTSTLTISAANPAVPGNYPLTVTATPSVGPVRSAALTLTVTD